MAKPIIQIPSQATNYSMYDPPAIPGLPTGAGAPVVLPFQNLAMTAKAKWTVGIPATVDANSTYSLTVNGQTVSVNTAADTTQAQLGTMLLSALRASMSITMGKTVMLDSNTITITSLNPGEALTVSSTSNASTTNDLTLTEVESSGEEAVIPFGRFVGKKFDYPNRTAALVSSNSGTYSTGNDGFLVFGVTVNTQATMRVGRGLDAVGGYSPWDTMNVWTSRGNAQGIWVECTPENDITLDDSFGSGNLFIATTPGHEGKLTKDDTTYNGLALGGNVDVMEGSVAIGLNDWVIAHITFNGL